MPAFARYWLSENSWQRGAPRIGPLIADPQSAPLILRLVHPAPEREITCRLSAWREYLRIGSRNPIRGSDLRRSKPALSVRAAVTE